MTKCLEVLAGGKLIGHLHDRAPLTFAYTNECLSGLLRSPISNIIPLIPGDIASPEVLAYFENLLPEGDQRRSLEEKHHVTSVFGLLWTAGWDTAGAIVLQPAGLSPNAPEYVKRSWADVAVIISGHGIQGESSKASISGAQYKLLLSIDDIDASPLLPKGSSPSTHILKPNIQRAGQKIWASAINETLMMRAAAKCGLQTAHVEYIGTVKACLVTRYDRAVKDKQVTRLNQFDLCQLLKTPSGLKYESEGGPGFVQCYLHVKTVSANPVKDCESLLKWLFFNLCIGNNDSHAKNLSMLQTSAGLRLAPFYDLMCTTVYPGFSSNFAFSVGGTFKPGDMTANEIKALADAIHASDKYMLKLAKDMADRVSPAIQDSIQELKASFNPADAIMAERLSHEVTRICKKRKGKFLAPSPKQSRAINNAAPSST
jgi:serine/threonine-protein kinase HipA